MIHAIQPDLVITDLMMPDVDGFTVINTMKNSDDMQSIPIVVVTAKELTVRERQQLDEQADMVLQKGSFISEDLIEQLVQKLG